MAFTCGFFNSDKGDRKYNAEQISAIFDGIIADGVFATIGDHMMVTAGTGMQVRVGTGKAWFDHTWNVNDSLYPLEIATSDVSLDRIDAIVLETNHDNSVRFNGFKVIKGSPAADPAKPTLTNTEVIHQHPLAWVRVKAGAAAITASMIENAVGKSECPFVTGIIEFTNIDEAFNQWQGDFEEWFANLKTQLSGDVAANLQRQIDERVKISDKATSDDISNGVKNKWVDAADLVGNIFSPGDVKLSQNYNQPETWRYTDGSPFVIAKASPLIAKSRTKPDVYYNDATYSRFYPSTSIRKGCGVIHNGIVYLLYNYGRKYKDYNQNDNSIFINMYKIPLTEDGLVWRSKINQKDFEIPIQKITPLLPDKTDIYPCFISISDNKLHVFFVKEYIHLNESYQLIKMDIDIETNTISDPIGIALSNLSSIPASFKQNGVSTYFFKQYENDFLIVDASARSIIEYKNGGFFWREMVFQTGYTVEQLDVFHSRDGWYFARYDYSSIQSKKQGIIWRGLNCIPLDTATIPWISTLNASTTINNVLMPRWNAVKQKYAWVIRTYEVEASGNVYYTSVYETDELDSDTAQLISKIKGSDNIATICYGTGYYSIYYNYPRFNILLFEKEPHITQNNMQVGFAVNYAEPIVSHAGVDYFVVQRNDGDRRNWIPMYIGDTAGRLYDFVPTIADTSSGKHFIKMR